MKIGGFRNKNLQITRRSKGMEVISDQQKHDLNEIMGADTNDKTVMGAAIFNYIREAAKEQRAMLLDHVMKNFGFVPKSHQTLANEGLSDSTWEVLLREMKATLTEKVEELLGNDRPESAEAVSQQMWQMIAEAANYENKVFLLTLLLQTPLAPLLFPEDAPGSVHMTDEEYELMRANTLMGAMDVMLARMHKFDTFTQWGGAVLHAVKQADTHKKRTMLMVPVLIGQRPSDEEMSDLPGQVDMTQQEYSDLTEAYAAEILQLAKIMESHWLTQKTERAGAISQLILSSPDEKVQAVLMAHVLRLAVENSRSGLSGIGVIELGPEGIKIMGSGSGEMPEILMSLLGQIASDRAAEGDEGALDLLAQLAGHDPEKCATCDKTSCPVHPAHKSGESSPLEEGYPVTGRMGTA
ncbi:hypothetical protein ACFL2U_02415 [Patescibacteria group bacterium]